MGVLCAKQVYSTLQTKTRTPNSGHRFRCSHQCKNSHRRRKPNLAVEKPPGAQICQKKWQWHSWIWENPREWRAHSHFSLLAWSHASNLPFGNNALASGFCFLQNLYLQLPTCYQSPAGEPLGTCGSYHSRTSVILQKAFWKTAQCKKFVSRWSVLLATFTPACLLLF